MGAYALLRRSPEVCDNPRVTGKDGKAQERSNSGYMIGKYELGHKCRDEILMFFTFVSLEPVLIVVPQRHYYNLNLQIRKLKRKGRNLPFLL